MHHLFELNEQSRCGSSDIQFSELVSIICGRDFAIVKLQGLQSSSDTNLHI